MIRAENGPTTASRAASGSTSTSSVDLDVAGQPGDAVDQFRGVGGSAADDRELHPNAFTSAPCWATWQAACGRAESGSAPG